MNYEIYSSVVNPAASFALQASDVEQFGLVQAVDGLGQRVVVTDAFIAHRRLCYRLIGQFADPKSAGPLGAEPTVYSVQ